MAQTVEGCAYVCAYVSLHVFLSIHRLREELEEEMAQTVEGKIAEMKVIVENDYRIREEEQDRCVCERVCLCGCAGVRACMHACMCVCVCVRA